MAEKYYKHPQFGHVYGQMVPTPVARVAWLSLVTPKAPPATEQIPNPVAKYQVTFIFPKDTEETKAFVAVLKTMTDDMLKIFNNKRSAPIAGVTIMKDGDTFDLEKYPYYKGSWVLQASNVKKFSIVDGKKENISPETVLGGMFCRGVVNPLITAHGVSYKIEMLQAVKDDGVRIAGGRPDAGSYLDIVNDAAPVEEAPKQVSKTDTKAASAKQNALGLL